MSAAIVPTGPASSIIDSVIRLAHPVVTTDELDRSLAFNCARLSYLHPAYDVVGGRIEMGRLHKETPATFGECVRELMNTRMCCPTPTLTSRYLHSVHLFLPSLEAMIVEERDFNFTYDAVLALEDNYLLRSGERVLERPQYMFMRLSVVSSADNLVAISETYEQLSQKLYFYGSTAMIYAGTTLGQMVPSFSLRFDTDDDAGRLDTLTQCAMINYGGGSVGLGIFDYPPNGSEQALTDTGGLRLLLRLLHDMSKRIGGSASQGRGRITAYIQPWHPELYVFLNECKRMTRETFVQTRGLFYGVCIPDIFMRRVDEHGIWSFFNPADVPDLMNAHGSAFDDLYCMYENQNLATNTLPALDVWNAILLAEMEALGPAIVFKDAMNKKSNLAHEGCINFAGQAADSVLPSSVGETAICNTASIALPAFVLEDKTFDHERLHDVVKTVTRSLNRMMALNSFPSLASAISYVRHRALGIGVMGFAEALINMRMGFESTEAMETGRSITETIYHAALEASCDLVGVYGIHPSFPGSALSLGKFQFDLWDVPASSKKYDWEALRVRIQEIGTANGQLVMMSDTTGCARLSGYTEACEPLLSNLMSKRSGSDNYLALNPLLVRDIQRLGLWTEELRLKLMLSRGSVRFLYELPSDLRKLYKSAWEIDVDLLLQHAIFRGPFVCQSQSVILYKERPCKYWLSNALFLGWKGGLKTGLFLLRSVKRSSRLSSDDGVNIEYE
ncbi:hypothetical protein CVT26_003817 [Gymnopilus dilepis]|uniref:Ribonucleoside-diphosphate reductase n=1 Tax=Gymnopilus dilepis TaxID=231916 RepID=A0A409YM73_9AGAR|nr:hypothetical protein CVT26_003817 [Gymnopilus dilepis]